MHAGLNSRNRFNFFRIYFYFLFSIFCQDPGLVTWLESGSQIVNYVDRLMSDYIVSNVENGLVSSMRQLIEHLLGRYEVNQYSVV